MSNPTHFDVVVEGGSYHTWTNGQLQTSPGSARVFTTTHSYKSSGFRTFLNPRQPKETPAQ